MVGAAETPYDLRFRLLGIPVRVHRCSGWSSAVLGWREHDLPMVVALGRLRFVSILVHEYGHGLMATAFRCSPSIRPLGDWADCATVKASARPWCSGWPWSSAARPRGLGFYLLVMVASFGPVRPHSGRTLESIDSKVLLRSHAAAWRTSSRP